MESERKHEVCSHIANLFDVWHPKMRPESGMPFQFSGFTEFQLFSWLKTWWSGPNLNLKRKGPQIPWGLHWICCFCDQQNVRKQKILFPIHRFYRIPTGRDQEVWIQDAPGLCALPHQHQHCERWQGSGRVRNGLFWIMKAPFFSAQNFWNRSFFPWNRWWIWNSFRD